MQVKPGHWGNYKILKYNQNWQGKATTQSEQKQLKTCPKLYFENKTLRDMILAYPVTKSLQLFVLKGGKKMEKMAMYASGLIQWER